MKLLKKIGFILLAAIVLAQFFSPKENNGELSSLTLFINETKPSEEVHKILKTACFDCHSNTTRYPWYSKITPINFWMTHHIDEGKEELNFSEWANYSLKRKEHKMEEVYEEVEKRHMPLGSYTWTHTDARLSDEEIQKVVLWAKQAQSDYKKQLEKE
ncbi:heme-binding domain-containing protein [Tenacibaculum adriaticum]|nr:heme-binding domain-containing protein [Tenacibaculum adriaticum]